MQTHDTDVARRSATAPSFAPLDQETRATVGTKCAAYHLDRAPQTLRAWSCLGRGPLKPISINGRLAWRTDDLRKLLGVKAA